MKHLFFLCAMLLMLAPCSGAASGTQFYTEMPLYLRFTQETIKEPVAEEVFLQRTYPDTANDAVDAAMRELIDSMAKSSLPLLPLEKGSVPSYLDVGAVVSRTGTSVLSFLTLAEVTKDMEHLSCDYQTRVWDVETGKQLTLSDFFPDDSGAWEILRSAVRDQLTAAFPTLEHDAAALERLLTGESLKNAPFTLGAARLTLTYRADALYPGKNTLLHVHVYYPEIREMMTDFGKAQTDNSRFKMIALTYDDGGARGYTRSVLNVLREYGAQATFFIVGRNIARNHDIHALQQNGGYSIQSHTYSHKYPSALKIGEAQEEKARMEQELGDLIGVIPTMMRAPGGEDGYFSRRELGYPLINWSAPSGDSGNDNVNGIIKALKNRAREGAIVLMHDINPRCHKYSEAFLDHLAEQGYLCVTVEELFCDAGVLLEPNKIYHSPYRVSP